MVSVCLNLLGLYCGNLINPPLIASKKIEKCRKFNNDCFYATSQPYPLFLQYFKPFVYKGILLF